MTTMNINKDNDEDFSTGSFYEESWDSGSSGSPGVDGDTDKEFDKESHVVSYVRMFAIIMLLVAGAALSISAYFLSTVPILATSIVVLVFAFIILIFASYDKVLAKSQEKIIIRAKQSNAIVSQLFPATVRDRMYDEAESGKLMKRQRSSLTRLSSSCEDFPSGKSDLGKSEHTLQQPKPSVIADRYPDCTVCFSDLVGFTSWSSQRSPEDVFFMLEEVYALFDKNARRRSVYKVETIGDCYMSVTGLPEPQKDHAEIMSKFAIDCRASLARCVRKLSLTLGPDTAELKARFGLHSGPVTAGVLRGERGRFQLFGDTVNTASRMESTGEADMIQISASVEILCRGNKQFTIQPRGKAVHAKGKGTLETFWLMPSASNAKSMSAWTSSTSLISSEGDAPTPFLPVVPMKPCRALNWKAEAMVEMNKTAAQVDWLVELLVRQLNQVVEYRKENLREDHNEDRLDGTITGQTKNPFEEVADYIEFPKSNHKFKSGNKQELPMEVLLQLRELVTTISLLYRDSNSFHAMEHACKVTLAMCKFLSQMKEDFDPLSRLACLFAALVHDLDHCGVTNAQLNSEKAYVAQLYDFKSPLEQHSFDLFWETLMQERFADLQACIFTNQGEAKLFRQIIVQLVLSTDIFGPLKVMRDERWDKEFRNTGPELQEPEEVSVNRKKTLVLETLMQASDIAHSMENFDVYLKWNKKLFSEMKAHQSGSAAKDTADSWYDGELFFFENIVIPLGRRMEECRAFGHAADDCLENARNNRNFWAEHGKYHVAEMLKSEGEGTN